MEARGDVEFELPGDVRLPSASAAEQVVATLRRLIVEGSVPPGARLRETQLAAGFDVSRQTVREAIRQLVHDGLVHHSRHRGAVVVDLGPDDVTDIYALRRVLELAGVERLPQADEAAVAGVAQAFERLAQAARSGAWAAVVEADIAFHHSITALSGSPRMVRSFDMVADELAFCLSVLRHVGQEERAPAGIIAEHESIAAAIAARDAGTTRRLVIRHLEVNVRQLARTLSERRDPAASEPGRRAVAS